MSVQILKGDCREVLRTLDTESVQTCITSPPYWGLRDYGIPPSVWGGNADCEHEWAESLVTRKGSTNGREGSTLVSAGAAKTIGVGAGNNVGETKQYRADRTSFCHCGAWRGSFGLEPTYQLYVEHAVEIFREVRRVLRPDATLWLNLGDCYCSGNRATWCSGASENKGADVLNDMPRPAQPADLKPKDLIGIPWRVAFALQADGWYLRQDIIWSKPNPMPESVTDRPTKAHEYLFLLTKNEHYYYDAGAIKEDSITDDPRRPYTSEGAWQIDGRPVEQRHGGKLRAPANVKRGGFDGKTNDLPGREAFRAFTETRNKRSVWTVSTQSFKEAHFATFPPTLIEPCIKAGCPAGGTVLDPFGGAGTTGLVADRLGRDAILIELNPEYADMAKRRIEGDAGLFADVRSEKAK